MLDQVSEREEGAPDVRRAPLVVVDGVLQGFVRSLSMAPSAVETQRGLGAVGVPVIFAEAAAVFEVSHVVGSCTGMCKQEETLQSGS